jgi:hypothetical protein
MQRIRAELADEGDDSVERTVDEPDLGS